MPENALNQLLGEFYYSEAVRCSQSRSWADAHQHLKGMSQLLPGDYRSALLYARILLRQGQFQAALDSLLVARNLGHDAQENQAMIQVLIAWDDKRRARRRRGVRVRKAMRSLRRSIRGVSGKVIANLCALFSKMYGLVRKPAESETGVIQPVPEQEAFSADQSDSPANRAEEDADAATDDDNELAGQINGTPAAVDPEREP